MVFLGAVEGGEGSRFYFVISKSAVMERNEVGETEGFDVNDKIASVIVIIVNGDERVFADDGGGRLGRSGIVDNLGV